MSLKSGQMANLVTLKQNDTKDFLENVLEPLVCGQLSTMHVIKDNHIEGTIDTVAHLMPALGKITCSVYIIFNITFNVTDE
jgi:hypothetical protein